MGKLTPQEFQNYLKQIRAMAEGPFEELETEVQKTDVW